MWEACRQKGDRTVPKARFALILQDVKKTGSRRALLEDEVGKMRTRLQRELGLENNAQKRSLTSERPRMLLDAWYE